MRDEQNHDYPRLRSRLSAIRFWLIALRDRTRHAPPRYSTGPATGFAPPAPTGMWCAIG